MITAIDEKFIEMIDEIANKQWNFSKIELERAKANLFINTEERTATEYQMNECTRSKSVI